MSFAHNLYQQATNVGFQAQQGYPNQVRPGINYNNLNGMCSSNLASPTSTLTHNQANSQFLQFANKKSNSSAATLISQMSTRPVTEYMPASSDTRWQ
ncbi:unnamed protein product [Rotaria magnacalcarata]|nr:unnamed protein product [Rotaria magnacalcarata]CAF4376643.1 unnamed protein product [Rotaria magnacalcarata]CAF5161898.1 unnamed protein product [Rotaria magnacalcarata]